MFEYAVAEGVSVSFQRYRCPAADGLTGLPTSAGALPLCIVGATDAAARLLVALPAGEACWIGITGALRAAPALIGLLARTGGNTWLDLLSGVELRDFTAYTSFPVPPSRQILGIPKNDGGWLPFCLEASSDGLPASGDLVLVVGPDPTTTAGQPRTVEIRFAGVEDFEQVCGERVPELNTDSVYKGRRLP
jgi:hypothetical protein